ncbi:MAG: hypothetical protein ACI94Y_004057, partial [Maribacter sp.]
HSRFLSHLLNPKASHQKGDVFLKLFLKEYGIDLGDTKDLKVLPNEYDKKEYQNMDILVRNRKEKKALMIENKIWAGDSNHEDRGQIEGYTNILIEEGFKDITVFYLTPFGRKPSNESLGKYVFVEHSNDSEKNVEKGKTALKGSCISYQNDILPWLEKCLPLTVSSPYLRESISQYLKLIKKMTNKNVTTEHQEKMMEVIGKNEENLGAFKQMINNKDSFHKPTVISFWEELQKEIEYRNYNIIQEFNKEIISKNAGILEIEFEKDGLSYIFECDSGDCFLLTMKSNKIDTGNIEKIRLVVKENIKEFWINEKNQNWGFVFVNYFFEKGKRVCFFKFNDILDFISPKIRKETINKIMKEVDDFIQKVNKELTDKK